MSTLEIRNRKYRQRDSKTHRMNVTSNMLNKETTHGLRFLRLGDMAR